MSFAYKATFTVDKTKVPSTQTGFPVLVSVTDTTLKTTVNGGQVQNANGYDIRFYSDSNLTTTINFELESYNASSGAIVFWVYIASLSSSSNTVFYAGYGDSSLNTNASSTSTWDTDYSGVWHLITVTGGASTVLDSTSNAVNGSPVASPTNIAGQIDGAGSFASASTQYVTLGNTINPTAITMSAWVKGTSFPNAYNSVVVRGSVANYAELFVKSTGTIAVYTRATLNVSYDGTGTNTLSTGTWYYLAFTYDSTNGLIGYVNAGSDATVAQQGALATAGENLRIASDPSNSGTREWNGILDEVRISKIARSPNWITTEYNNQLNPAVGGFYTSISYASLSTGWGPLIGGRRNMLAVN